MASIQYVVNATDAASSVFAKIGLSADNLDRQLEELGKRIADPEVTLDDSKFTLGMIRAAQRLDKLSARVADPKVTVDTGQAQVEILRINAMLDRLDAKRVSVTVGAGRRGLLGQAGRALFSLSALQGLFGGGAGAAGAGVPAGGAALNFLGSPAGIGAAAAAAFPGASLIDVLLGQGAGTGVAGAGALLAQMFQPSALAPAISNIKRTLSTVTQSFAPTLGLMMVQFGKFVQGLAPMLAKLFGSSLPFMRQFLSLAEQAAKTILPALTQVLQQMVASGALKQMTQGFVFLIQGVAGFIKAIGPGFKAGAEIFRGVMLGIKGLLIGLGATFGWMGRVTGDWMHRMHEDFTSWRHDTAAIFDAVRHDIAAAWNAIVNAASSAWDLLVKATKAGLITVVSLFTGLPDRAIHALWGFGHKLAGFASAAMTEMWNGIKSVGSGILGWFGGFVSRITGFFSHLLHHSPTGDFYHMGRNMMEGLAMGLRDHAHLVASSIGAVTGALGGAGTGVQRWAPVALQALRMLGQPSGDLGVVLAQMQTESGGNPVIVNKWDSNWAAGTPSVGLMQVIGPTFGAYAGPFRNVGPFEYGTSVNPLANLYAGLNYAIHRYGPAWTRVLGQGHGYDQGGWLPPGVTLAVNRTGVPERVLPPGAATGNTYITVQVGHGTHPVAAAQEIVKLLNAGAKSGVKLRTSILGPG